MSESRLRVDPQVFQAILLSRIERKLREIDARLEAVEARGVPFSSIKIYQYKKIQAGRHGVVCEYKVAPFVAFIYYIGCNWFADTYYLWEIDGLPKERIERIIGNSSSPTSEPLRLEKPIVARDKIKWTAYNDSSTDHFFEVLNDGVLYPPGVAKYLGGAEIRSG